MKYEIIYDCVFLSQVIIHAVHLIEGALSSTCCKVINCAELNDLFTPDLKRFSHGLFSKIRTTVDCPLTALNLSRYSAEPGSYMH